MALGVPPMFFFKTKDMAETAMLLFFCCLTYLIRPIGCFSDETDSGHSNYSSSRSVGRDQGTLVQTNDPGGLAAFQGFLFAHGGTPS
jgi:hypothetical protein